MSSFEKIRWGILGCANIARKIIPAINDAANSELIAISSRSMEKVIAYGIEMGLPETVTLYDNYQSVLDDARVDAVYIPLPTTLHLHWVTAAANAGKHVLIEKPVAINAAEFRQMVNVCCEKGVLLMDGTMFMHHKRTDELKKLLSSPDCGSIQRVDSCFSFPGDRAFFESNIRTRADGDPMGALGDLGWYCVRLGIIAYSKGTGIRFPVSCSAVCNTWTTDGEVPLDAEARVFFGDNRSELLSFNSSFLLPLRQKYEICCCSRDPTKGDVVLTCDDFVLPVSDEEASLIRDISPPANRPHKSNAQSHLFESVVVHTKEEGTQQSRMIAEFSRIVQSDSIARATYWQQIALATQATMDACLISMREGGREVEVVCPTEQFI